MSKQIKFNLYTYFAFISIAIIGILYGEILLDKYSNLRMWTIHNILLMLIGIPFLFIFNKSNIPDFWQDNISNKTRIWFPLIIGLIFGLFDIIIFKIILHPEPYTELPPFAQPFPYSILLFFSGAFEIEVFYRLIPLTLICFVGTLFKKGHYFNYLFIFGAILTSLREPLEQLQTGAFWLVLYSFLSGFAMNFIQALYFRKTGFIGSLSIRLGHYLLWHIILGIYIQQFEL